MSQGTYPLDSQIQNIIVKYFTNKFLDNLKSKGRDASNRGENSELSPAVGVAGLPEPQGTCLRDSYE